MRRVPLLAVVAAMCAASLVLAGCGGDDQPREGSPRLTTTSTQAMVHAAKATNTPAANTKPTTPTTAMAPLQADVTIVAKGVAFVSGPVEVAAGTEVTITFDNQDVGIPHNLDLQLPGGGAKTDIATGATKQSLKITVAKPGTYDFICDVHPTQMKGQLTAR